MEEQKQKFNLLNLVMIVLVVLVSSAVVGGLVYYYLNQSCQNGNASSAQLVVAKKSSSTPSTEVKAPTKSPQTVVNEYVELYRENQKETGSTKPYLTQAFAGQSFGNALPLGMQNSIPTTFKPTFTEKVFDDGTAYVLMLGKWSPTLDFNREFVLVKVSNEWKIASIKEYSPWPPQ